jgi:hypothetical protein
MSDENAIYAVKPEYVRVLRRSYLVCTDPQQYAMETMRAIAQAANECGLEGKQLTGIAFDNASSQGPDPDIILEIRKREPMDAETLAGVEEGLDDIRKGRTIPLEEYKKTRGIELP